MFTNSYQSLERKQMATKPKPPLSAYNLFFQLERRRILDGTDQDDLPITLEELGEIASIHKRKTGKRVHRRTHGKIGFGELARTIAARWKRISPDARAVLDQQARLEKLEYGRHVRIWQETQEDKQRQAQKDAVEHTANINKTSAPNDHRQTVLPTLKKPVIIPSSKTKKIHQQSSQSDAVSLHLLQELLDRVDAEMSRTSNSISPPLHNDADFTTTKTTTFIDEFPTDSFPEMTTEPVPRMARTQLRLEERQQGDGRDDELALFLSSPIFQSSAAYGGRPVFDPINSEEMDALFSNEEFED